ncbi:T9SS type A sorting domain-containing protein [uncultured Marivirga sp.]|uniref:T9SS type A sorting domain-containing protein n=1 Tax=uncultured Marivirga sp. TaxID=1123707 RepID=UPI0030EE760B|tara:strand:- start:83571 stop:88193 length:4623 start_codon:yes stop_codon:yes gene_type:complete
MKRFLLSILFFVGVVSMGLSQDFIAMQDGSWNDGATWGNLSPGTEGVDWPSSGDDVAIDGFNVSLARNGNFTCNTLFVRYNIIDQLTIAAGRGALPTLTIQEAIISEDPSFVPTAPTVQIFNSNIDFTFTGEKITGFSGLNSILGVWSTNCVFGEVFINQVGAEAVRLNEILPINTSIDLNSGTFEIQSSGIVAGTGVAASFNLNSSAILTVNGAINGDGSPTSRFNAVNFQGDVTTGISGYVNSTNFVLGAASTLIINFNGVNQTQGWWYQSAGPTGTFSIDPTSTVIYNASVNQVVGAQEYGDLKLRSQGGSSIKTLQAAGNLLVQGLLRLNSGNVTFDTSPNTNPINLEGNVENLGNWSPSQRVIFSGTAAQSINGTNQITFGGGIRVGNTTGLTLNNVGVSIDNELDIDPSCSFDPSDQVVTMSGNFRVDGDLIAGTDPGGFIFDGTTAFLGGGTRAFYNVEIDGAGTLTAPTGIMEVQNNWTNDGVFNDNLGTVLFSNPDPVTVSGSSLTSFYNLTLEGVNTATVEIDGNVDLENVLSFTGSPAIDLDGSANSGVFTLKSTATRDAAVANVGTANIQGNAVVERYITGGTGASSYHYIGSPIATTISDWQNEFYVTGNFTGASTGPGINSSTPSIYIYNESLGGGINDRYVAYPTTNNSAPVQLGVGYAVSLRSAQETVTANTIGEFHTGQATWNVTDQGGVDDGWNLISNQFPSAIDFDAAGWNKANIENGFYVYDPIDGNQYYTSGGGSTAGMDQYIAMGQAFWVRATSSGTVTAQESVKYTGGTPEFFKENPKEKIKIIFEGNERKDDSYIIFNNEATDAYDPRFDFSNLRNDQHNISSLTTDAEDLKVNHMANLNEENKCGKSIPLFVRSNTTGQFSLKFEELNSIKMSESIYLIDNFSDEVIEINEGSVYDFEITADIASKGSERFELSFETKVPKSVETVAEDICPNQSGEILLKSTEDFANYLLYKNNEVISSAEGNGGDLNFEIESEQLSDGLNEFTIKSFIGGCDTLRVGSAQIRIKEVLSLDNEVVGSSVCKVETQAAFSVNTQVGATYYIMDGQETVQTFQGNGSQYDGYIAAENLNDGLNEFVITADKDGCQSGTLEQVLEIVVENLSIDRTVTFETSDICNSNEASINFKSQANVEYKFYKNDEIVNTLIGDGSNQSFTIPSEFVEVGNNEYSVMAYLGSCSEYEFAEKISLTVEESIQSNLDIVTENVCGLQNVNVIIENAQKAKKYSLVRDGEIAHSATANTDGQLSFTLDSSKLKMGINQYNILIEGEYCQSINAEQIVEFELYEDAVIESIENQNICLNGSATIEMSANVKIDKYLVYIGNELISETQSNIINLEPKESTTYKLTGVPANGCKINDINFTIEVTDLTVPGILVSGNVLESSIEGDSYQWYLDGNQMDSETGKVLVANASGDYKVEVSKGDCSNISESFTFNEEVLNANKALENALKLYPNPVIDKMFIDLNNINSVDITIFTITGKFIDSFVLNASHSEIDMAKFSKGTYLIQIESDKGVVTKRIVKQ